MAYEHALVVDVGSSSTKFGYSGEDVPSWVIPTAVDRSKFGKGTESVENATFNPHKEDDEKVTAAKAAAAKADAEALHARHAAEMAADDPAGKAADAAAD